MKKKLFLIISLCMLVLSLAACGEDPKKVDYNGVTYDQLQSSSQRLINSLLELTEEDVAMIKQNSDELTVNLVLKWETLTPQAGEFKDFGEFSIDKSGKTLTTSQILDFTKRDITLTCVYDYQNMEISDITLDEIYTLGETMQKAAMNTLMGMGTVFAILILISLIIWGFKVIPYLQQKAAAKKQPQIQENETRTSEIKALTDAVQLSSKQQEQAKAQTAQEDDLELVAVISAAIAAATGTTTEGFVVRSIRKRKLK